jgi:hypothetical protein
MEEAAVHSGRTDRSGELGQQMINNDKTRSRTRRWRSAQVTCLLHAALLVKSATSRPVRDVDPEPVPNQVRRASRRIGDGGAHFSSLSVLGRSVDGSSCKEVGVNMGRPTAGRHRKRGLVRSIGPELVSGASTTTRPMSARLPPSVLPPATKLAPRPPRRRRASHARRLHANDQIRHGGR